MKELASFLAKSLAEVPDQVEVESHEEGSLTRLILRVAEEDKGKIIGKQGKVIKAMRAVVGLAAAKANRRALLDVE